MDMRAEVWSPLQNAAVWLGAWLYGLESTDALLTAWHELGGRPQAHGADTFVDVLAEIRAAVQPLLEQSVPEPVLRLVLSGPGEPPLLPAGSEAAALSGASASGSILVRTGEPLEHLVLIPHVERDFTAWELLSVAGNIPAPAWLSPGEADSLLTQATNEAAELIAARAYPQQSLPNARLTVGTLADFYDTPGLPSCVPARAAKLFARADRVSAIIETITERLGDHTYDGELLRLLRHIRQARMAGVSYALADFAR